MAARKPFSVTAEVDAVLGPPPPHHTQPEVVVLKFRRHGRRLALPVIALIVVAAATGFWAGTFSNAWSNLAVGLAAVAVAVVLGVIPIIAWLVRRTTITTKRVITRRGVFVHERAELSWHRVREVRTRRGIWQRLFRAGDIELLHGTERMLLQDVPHARLVAEALQELMERNYHNTTQQQTGFFMS